MKQFFHRFLVTALLTMTVGLSNFSPTPTHAEAVHFSSSIVSTGGTDNTLASSNTGRKVATNADGQIFVAYYSTTRGVRVARSTNRGESFQTDVQVANEYGEPDIAIDPRTSYIYLAWVNADSDLRFSRSTDGGLTFSTPTTIDNDGTFSTFHMAALSPYVYLVRRNGTKVYINNANGVGGFTSTTVDSTPRVFADIGIDPYTETVYIQDDDPNVIYFSSTNHGASFTPAPQPVVDIYYSVSAFAFTPTTKYMYSSGGLGTSIRVNLQNNTFISMPISATINNQTRSLAADASGNVVSTLLTNTNDAQFEVSTNYGESFQAPVTVINGAPYMSAAINNRYGDIVLAYEYNGRIYVATYTNQLAGYTSASGSGHGTGLPLNAFFPPNKEAISFTINEGQATTADAAVGLNLKAGEDVTKMAISSEPDFKNTGIEPFANSKAWKLCTSCTAGATYTVYAKLYTAFGQSVTVSDEILYNPTKAVLGEQVQNGSPAVSQPPPPPAFIFTRNLRLGSRHPDVIKLQQYLNTHGFTVATSGPGSPGQEVAVFGNATKKALMKLQTAHKQEILTPAGLTVANGICGSLTRNYLNQHP